MSFVKTLHQYIKDRDEDFQIVADDTEDYIFSRHTEVNDYNVLIEISVDHKQVYASVRVYLTYFFDDQDYARINQLNQDYRFTSFYQVDNSLIMEQDLMVQHPESARAVIEIYILLLEITHTLTAEKN